MKFAAVAPILASLILAAGCSSSPESPKKTAEAPAKETAAPQPKSPQTFKVRFVTSKGPFVMEVHNDWAPRGAAHFADLVKAKFYDGARFFRVVPNFVIQFGLAANPAVTRQWAKPIYDDPVMQTNRLGSVAFATEGFDTRTTQIFINLHSNQDLDGKGFSPFAQVIEGMDVVNRLYSGYREAPDQQQITKSGNAYLLANFPKLDYIKTARIVP